MHQLTPFDFMLITFAALYLADAITRLKGAFNALSILRDRLPLGGLTSCVYCLIIWIALAFYLLLQTDVYWIVYPFALSGAAMAIYNYTGYGLHE